MKGPKKLDENRARTIRNRGGKNPSLHSATIPENAGTRLLKYTWEDNVCVVRIFVKHVPGYKSWAEADISSKGISVRWEDRESILLLLHNSKKENFYLHIPELYRDVEDVRTVWKRNKCIIKITKRVYEVRRVYGGIEYGRGGEESKYIRSRAGASSTSLDLFYK